MGPLFLILAASLSASDPFPPPEKAKGGGEEEKKLAKPLPRDEKELKELLKKKKAGKVDPGGKQRPNDLPGDHASATPEHLRGAPDNAVTPPTNVQPNEPGGYVPSSVSAGAGGEVTAAPSEQALRSQAQAGSQLGSSSRKAMSRAMNAAKGLKQAFPDLGAGGLGAGTGAAQDALGSAPGADPLRDLAVAQAGGASHAFRELGLQARADASGRLQLTRADGAAASPAEVAVLRRRLAEQPQALERHPHFFDVLEPRKFEQLKTDHASATPEQRAATFRDVALTPERRDFQWSRTCSTVSGDCNPHSTALSYEKGSFVPPGELKKMHEELHPEDASLEEFLSDSEYSDEEEKEASQALAALHGPRGGALAALGVGRLLSKVGFDSAPSQSESGGLSAIFASALPWTRSAEPAGGPAASAGSSRLVAYGNGSAAAKKAGAGARTDSPAPLLPRLLTGLGLCLLLAGWLRRKR